MWLLVDEVASSRCKLRQDLDLGREHVGAEALRFCAELRDGTCERRTRAVAAAGDDHAANTVEARPFREANASRGIIGTENMRKLSPLAQLLVDALVALIVIGTAIGGIAWVVMRVIRR